MRTMPSEAKIEEFLKRFPLLTPVARKLNEAGLDWLIGGSGCLFLFGNKRVPDDVDIYIPAEQHDRADELFDIKSYVYNSPVEQVRNSNPENNHAIQLTSNLVLNLDKRYDFELTDLIKQKAIRFDHEGVSFNLLPPEDVILIKALLQRGPEMGKKDVQDIKDFLAVYKIDQAYLQTRIKELGAEERVKDIF